MRIHQVDVRRVRTDLERADQDQQRRGHQQRFAPHDEVSESGAPARHAGALVSLAHAHDV